MCFINRNNWFKPHSYIHIHGVDNNGDSPLHIALMSRDRMLEAMILRMVNRASHPPRARLKFISHVNFARITTCHT